MYIINRIANHHEYNGENVRIFYSLKYLSEDVPVDINACLTVI
jgi:hypothetical protein